MANSWMLFGMEWLEKLQSALPNWVFSIFEVFSFLGTEEAYIVFLVAIWAVNYSLAIQVGLILMINNPINISLKMLYKLPRPYWVNPLIKGFGKAEIIFGFPSGHSQMPLAIYGYFTTHLKNKKTQLLIWAAIILIGISRLVLGMHYPLDVVVGWSIGAIFLWAFINFKDRVYKWVIDKTYKEQIFISLVISLVLLAFPIIVSLANQDYQVPIEWRQNANIQFPDVDIAPMQFSGAISAAATLFGLGAGGFWLQKKGGYLNTEEKNKQFIAFIIGLVGLLILKQGLGAVFPHGENLAAYVFRFVRYSLIGIWISGWAPALLIKYSIGSKENNSDVIT